MNTWVSDAYGDSHFTFGNCKLSILCLSNRNSLWFYQYAETKVIAKCICSLKSKNVRDAQKEAISVFFGDNHGQ